MIPNQQAPPLDWLRENCRDDGALLELLEALDRDGRDDLIFLMRDFRLPPLRTDEEIKRRVGSSEKVEGLLFEMHSKYFLPIQMRRRSQEVRRTKPPRIWAGIARRRDLPSWERVALDEGWVIAAERRGQIVAMLKCARRDQAPTFEELPRELGTSLEDVIDLVLEWDARRREFRREWDNQSRDERSLP